MSVNLIFKIAAVGILVSVLSQVLKHSGREEQAFLTSLAGLMLVLFLAAMGTGIAAVGIVALIYGLAGIALIVGIIAAAAQRIQELERGEEEDAKRY